MEKVTGIGGLFFRARYPNARFAHLRDPEGNPIELWEPKKLPHFRVTSGGRSYPIAACLGTEFAGIGLWEPGSP